MITETELSDIEYRLSKSNPGPWSMEDFGDGELKTIFPSRLKGFDGKRGQGMLVHESHAELIANAHSDITMLVEEVRRLRGELSKAEAGQKVIEAIANAAS